MNAEAVNGHLGKLASERHEKILELERANVDLSAQLAFVATERDAALASEAALR